MDNELEIEITPKTRANDIMRLYPEVTDYFIDLGICDCGYDGAFGKLSLTKRLEEVAREKNIPVDEMIESIKKLIKS